MPNQPTETKILIMPDTEAGLRLDIVLAKLLTEHSRTELKAWIEDGSIVVNDKPVKAKYKVKAHDQVTLRLSKREPLTYTAQAIALDIVYEDECILVINKPAGLVVHPGAGNHDSTLLNAILHHSPNNRELPRAGIVHRLDKNTTGLLVIAKSPQALKSLSHQIKKHQVVREYQAVVYGHLISGGTINQPLARHPLDRKKMAIIDTGKPAITHFRLLNKFPAHTHLLVRLETGRTHQIRVHLSSIKHPLIGDTLYGGRVKLSKGMSQDLIDTIRQFKRQALHAFKLVFTHPESGQLVTFEAPLPKDMEHLIEELKQ